MSTYFNINEDSYLDEKWKDIYINEELSKYMISNYGRVVSFHKNKSKLLKNFKTKSGYEYICLSHNGADKWCFIHRLVAEYFIEIPKELLQQGYSYNNLEVNHKNGTYDGKSDNRYTNLEWVTSSENKYHAYNTGLKKKGEESPASIYSEDKIIAACDLLEENKLSVRKITEMTGIPYSTLAQLLTKNQWKDITEKYDFSKRKKQHNLYPKEVRDRTISLLYDKLIGKNNYSYSDIGKLTGMSRTLVWYLYNHYVLKDKIKEC